MLHFRGTGSWGYVEISVTDRDRTFYRPPNSASLRCASCSEVSSWNHSLNFRRMVTELFAAGPELYRKSLKN